MSLYIHWKHFFFNWLLHQADGIIYFFLYWIRGLISIVSEYITNALNIIIYKSLYIFLGYLLENGPSGYELLKDSLFKMEKKNLRF